mmetsp:Transcript_22570/g.32998  ORF Transcript_22570/g.32998 Transcript_22570/m.32998 type:complete len:340 (-) Transcript_22570:223-1242(-)
MKYSDCITVASCKSRRAPLWADDYVNMCYLPNEFPLSDPHYQYMDMLTWNKDFSYMKKLEHNLSTAVIPDEKLIRLFNDKGKWKEFMHSIGLGEFVPKSYTSISTVQYPCVVKTNHHYGTGITVAVNEGRLRGIISAIPENEPYIMEESLTGMGLAEGGVYGSAYKGQPLVLMCSIITHREGSLKAKNRGVYIRTQGVAVNSTQYVSCGRDVARVVSAMFANLEPYTGLFCLNFKTNSTGHLKFMEVNARVCATMVISPVLAFVSVPLAFAIRDDIATAGGQLSHPMWYTNRGPNNHLLKLLKVVKMMSHFDNVTEFGEKVYAKNDFSVATRRGFWNLS